MNKDNYKAYRTLQNAGWNVQKHNQVRFNSGSETIKHAVSKMLVAQAGSRAGYRVSSEVEHQSRGKIDILLWGNPDRLTLAVEIETSPTDEIVQDKVDRYIDGTPIDDLVVINASELPLDMLKAYEQITEVLGLD